LNERTKKKSYECCSECKRPWIKKVSEELFNKLCTHIELHEDTEPMIERKTKYEKQEVYEEE
jgi:hypothetical protein